MPTNQINPTIEESLKKYGIYTEIHNSVNHLFRAFNRSARRQWNGSRYLPCRFQLSMGTAVSKRKNMRNDAISSVAAKVRAARAFGDYLPHNNQENHNGGDHLLSDTFLGHDVNGSSDTNRLQTPTLPPPAGPCTPGAKPTTKPPQLTVQPPQGPQYLPAPQDDPSQPSQASTPKPLGPQGPSKRRLTSDRSLSTEEPPPGAGLTSKPPRVYAVSKEPGGAGAMTLGGARGSEESLELDVLRSSKGEEHHHHHPHPPPPAPPTTTTPQGSSSSLSQPPPGASAAAASRGHHRGNHHRSTGGHHHSHGHQGAGGAAQPPQPLRSSGSAHNIGDWPGRRGGSREDCRPDCAACARPPCRSQRSLDLDTSPRDGGKHRKKLERMHSEDKTSTDDRDDTSNSWFPKENMFSFQTASTTMQAISNFRKHLRMVGSRRVKVQTFAERRAKSFSRSWSDPTPVKPDSLHDSRDSGDLRESTGTLDEGLSEDADWEEEREAEKVACEGDDFIPPKIMLVSSKVPKAEYVPNIIRREDPSVIPILYDHEHATFDDIIEEIEKKLTAYRKGCKIWNMLIFCQGGPGHLYLLKNKVATFAKVEKEDDMIQFWLKLSRLMSKLNPDPNQIHIMGCYVLGSANGEKLIENLKALMRPYSVEFKSPLELSAQGKEMIEMYFDFRLFRLWKSRQHSKMLDYDDLL
ncbi:NMDA receptor synaptonuclear signaling and neuronal migration factor isoform X2 [Gadus morhua]|uniref:NMDA receptor synaptonuclear signaling and neuronal migration factor isoform X2 n=1 Tax=Gadus morhua TaxID=8049 RepID=UPI0011B61424|nr:NMDA receptor synaptonuclear signaling and neuronal migration factor-like isoform X2 [Gadus morhua]